MIRPALLTCLLAAPALAGGPAWPDMVTEPDPAMRALGAVLACVNAVTDPAMVTAEMTRAGWEQINEYDGSITFQTDTLYLMYADNPGFCMIETSDFSTPALTDFLSAFDITPSGTDADGCTQFIVDTATATLTGGGNDPACISGTEAALRFEPTP